MNPMASSKVQCLAGRIFFGRSETSSTFFWMWSQFGRTIWRRVCFLVFSKRNFVLFPILVGDNESGKSVALSLLNWLCYRPMLGVLFPQPTSTATSMILMHPVRSLEDEAQGMQKDSDKSKIYKAGYKKGAVVPRTVMMQNKRFIKYFRVFCLKACAAEEMPRVKGLMERFIVISMTEGYPTKDGLILMRQTRKGSKNLGVRC